jgi:hypothetical protein
MTDEAYPGMLSPITNPQITGEDGWYAWDVADGKYRVKVSRPGFETTISREVTVPPAVTDLHVALTPTDHVLPTLSVTGVQNNQSYTAPVAVEFSGQDDEAGVRYVSYKLDGNNEVKIKGSSTNLTVENFGQHTLTLQVVDHAGNVKEEVVNFEIKQEQQAENIIEVITAAIEKSKEAKSEMDSAMTKMNANASKQEIEEHLNKANAAAVIVDEKIKKVKELFPDFESPTLSASLRQYMNIQLDSAESQNSTVLKKLAKAEEQLLSDDTYTRAKSRLKEAQTANKSVTDTLGFVKGILVLNPPK